MKLSLLLRRCGVNMICKDIQINALSANPHNVSKRGTLLAWNQNATNDDLIKASQNGAEALLVSEKFLPKKLPSTIKSTIKVGETHPPHSALWARICANWYGNNQPANVVAVTGTNGKSSVVSFIRQLWQYADTKGASLGTLGIETSALAAPRALTTQDPLSLHRDLALLKKQRITHLALEASSHGLAQRRLDGVNVKVAVFTNLTPEHLDYHRNITDYFEAKAILFKELNPQVAVINAGDKFGSKMANIARQNGVRVLTFGTSTTNKSNDLNILSIKPSLEGTQIKFRLKNSKTQTLTLPVVGEYQALNAMAALLACSALEPKKTNTFIKGIKRLQAPKGRMERASKNVFVDYCHNEDGLANALSCLKPLVKAKGRLLVVLGCGGDRDVSKRAKMGAVASTLADLVFVTDDNPRTEEPSKIRTAIIKGIEGIKNQGMKNKGIKNAKFKEIANRKDAIVTALLTLKPEDILLIAGKGDESAQVTANGVIPFSDISVATPIWESKTNLKAYGISIDSRTTRVGDLFIALKGTNTDGAKFLAQASKKGAVAALVTNKGIGNKAVSNKGIGNKAVSNKAKSPLPLVEEKEPLKALWQMAKKRRSQLKKCNVIMITGSHGKTTVKDYVASLLAHFGAVHSTKGNFNNLLGVPLTLASTPTTSDFAVFEAGMNRKGELAKINRLLKPQTALITTVAEAHSQFFSSLEAIAAAKAEALAGAENVILPRGRFFQFLKNKAKNKAKDKAKNKTKLITFGTAKNSNIQILLPNKITANGKIVANGSTLNVKDSHNLNNVAAAVAIASNFGTVTQAMIDALPPLPQGRGNKIALSPTVTLIDHSYNAAPASMEAALNALCHTKGTRVAVIAPMKELANPLSAHTRLAKLMAKLELDLVLLVGGEHATLMANILGKMGKKHKLFATPQEAIPQLESLITKAKTTGAKTPLHILLKGSNSEKLGQIVAHFGGNDAV